jgi:hypothetical protein
VVKEHCVIVVQVKVSLIVIPFVYRSLGYLYQAKCPIHVVFDYYFKIKMSQKYYSRHMCDHLRSILHPWHHVDDDASFAAVRRFQCLHFHDS